MSYHLPQSVNHRKDDLGFMSMVNVTGQGQIENLFAEHNFCIIWHSAQLSIKTRHARSRSQAKVKWKICVQNIITSLAQVSTIKLIWVRCMTRVFMSKVKVTGQGQMENLFLRYNIHILCMIFLSFCTSVALAQQCNMSCT